MSQSPKATECSPTEELKEDQSLKTILIWHLLKCYKISGLFVFFTQTRL